MNQRTQTAKVNTVILTNGEGHLIAIEACISSGYSGIQLLGNFGETCREGKERAKTALENCGYKLTQKRVLINASPANLKKEGNTFDLAIAMSLALLHQKHPPKFSWQDFAFLGEVDLTGTIKPIQSVVPLVLAALDKNLKGVVVPKGNLADLRVLLPLIGKASVQLYYTDHLKNLLDGKLIPMTSDLEISDSENISISNHHPISLDFDDMDLSEDLKKLIVCVISGNHHLLLSGAPGSGKSMLAERLSSVKPTMSSIQQLEVLKIYGLSQESLPQTILNGRSPYRAPHHSLSLQALTGTPDRAGEVSLAHHGILFLDEFPEFRRDALEALREPLESGIIQVSRAKDSTTWPANPQLIAACNPCPCGWYGSSLQLCRCPTQALIRYQNKLSGPLLDRIDIHFKMPDFQSTKIPFSYQQSGSVTRTILNDIEKTLSFAQRRRLEHDLPPNHRLLFKHLPLLCGDSDNRYQDLAKKCGIHSNSRRSLLKIFRIARTLADMAQVKDLDEDHLREAKRWHQPMVLLDENI